MIPNRIETNNNLHLNFNLEFKIKIWILGSIIKADEVNNQTTNEHIAMEKGFQSEFAERIIPNQI